jgi:hypothetical protein
VELITVIKQVAMVVHHITEHSLVVLVITVALVVRAQEAQEVVEVVLNLRLVAVMVAQEKSFTGFYV